ncbi:type III-B CRISPR module-associated Cmr3 family protein [Desulfoscipio gibsoniae]
MKMWKFAALDTFFFRDGMPYNAGEGGQTGVNGCFPPFMSTLQGVIRTTLAYGQGWTPETQQKWPEELGTPSDLGQLKLKGPYLLIDDQVLFAVPLLLSKQESSGIYVRLVPAEKEINCDLGAVRLPVSRPKLFGAKPPEKEWLTTEGMNAMLEEGVPAFGQVRRQDELWHEEYRVGLEIKDATRTAVDKKLYSCVHTRPTHNISLGVGVDGVPSNWQDNLCEIVRLGGEGRLARLDIGDFDLTLPECPSLKPKNGVVKFTVILITPAYFNTAGAARKAIQQGPDGIPGRHVSACIGKVQQAGGWDMVNHCPRPLNPVLPPGSAWFYEADGKFLEQIVALHGGFLGDNTDYGYGQLLIGRWGDE